MRRHFRLVVIAVGLALAVAIGAAAMGEAVGASGEDPEGRVMARTVARELRLREAEMQLQVALEALDVARVRFEQQIGVAGDVRERELDVMRAKRALAELKAMEVQRVSISVKDEKLTAVFTKLFEGTEQSVVLDPAVAELPRLVTLTFNDVSLESAVRAICKLYNLDYETDKEGLWAIMPSSGFATVGGARVPIIGTVTTLRGSEGGDTGVALRGITVSTGGGGGGGGFGTGVSTGGGGDFGTGVFGGGGRSTGLAEAPKRPSFPGDDHLVDLDVKDAPLSEVASRLSFKADPQPTVGPEWGSSFNYNVEVIAADAVKDLEVTAKIAKWPLGEVLDMLLAQTGLVCTVDASDGERGRVTGGGGTASRHYEIRTDPVTGEVVYPTIRVYLVPAPEMRVSGEGLPSEALVSRYMAISRAATGRADEVRVLQVSRECPKCHASILLPEWKFCPYCGAEAVAEEEQPEGAG